MTRTAAARKAATGPEAEARHGPATGTAAVPTQEAAEAGEAARAAVPLDRVPVAEAGALVDLGGRPAGGLTARHAEWSVDGARVLLTGAAPFVELSGRAGVRADGSFDGTVAMRAAVRLLGLDVAEAEWTVTGWAGEPLAAPAVTLRGSALSIDLGPVGADVTTRVGSALPVVHEGEALTVALPAGPLPPGLPVEPRVAELFRGIRGWDLSGVRVHPDAPVNGAPAFVTRQDLFFAPGACGANSPETVALLDAALRAALAGLMGPVTPTPPAPPPRAAEPGSPPSADTTPVPANVPAGVPAPAAATTAPEAPPAEAPPTEAPSVEPPTEPAAEPSPAAAGEEAPTTAGAPAAPIELLMPPAPTAPGPAALARGDAIGAAAGGAARAARDLPPAQETVDAARGAVTEPPGETAARAQQDLAAELGAQPAPSPEIVELCERIRTAIREHRPVDEDALLRSDPTREAAAAGATVSGSVDTQVRQVGSTYDGMASPPAGTPALTPRQITPPPAGSPGMGADAAGAAPDPIPAENLSLDGDVAATDARIAGSGVDTRVTREIPTEPFSAVREGRGELGEMAETTPQQLAEQQAAAIASAQADMASLQARATQALRTARAGTVESVGAGQGAAVTSEEQTREAVSRRAQGIFDAARTRVGGLLEPLSRTAMSRWETGLARESRVFHDALDRVQQWIDDRHSGVGGWIVGIGDAVFGLPDWVTEEYDRAERAFGDGVCELLLAISTEVNGVLAAAQAIIQQARDDIDAAFTAMEAEFPEFAARERARFGGMLDGLTERVTAARTSFVEDLSRRATQAVAEAQTAVEERREAARGVLGRIVAAIEAFLDDPVRAIINGLLTLVGIPPAAFWALVDRIQQVISDIADNPENFVNNLVAGVKQGFLQFFDNFGSHVLQGFWDWLFSGLQTPIPMPTDLSARSLFSFALQLMGITWPRVREILVRHIGAQNVELIEVAWQLITTLIERGPDGLVEMIKERLTPEVLVQAILEAAVEYLVETLIQQVVVRVVGLLNPVGAVAQAIDLIYQVCAWIFRNAARIFRFVEAVVNGMADVIAGNITGLANAVERALASLIPPVIDFLAGLLHLGDLPDEVAEVIDALQARVFEVMDLVIGALAERGRALLRTLGLGGDEEAEGREDNELGTTVRFAAAGHQHRVWVATAGTDATVMVASVPKSVAEVLGRWQDDLAAGKPAANDARTEATSLIGQAEAVADETNATGDALAAEFLAAAARVDDEVRPPSDDVLENRERALAGMLRRLFELMEQKDPEEYVRDIAAHLPRHAARYAGTVRDQWLPRIRRVERTPPGGPGGERVWPDTVLAGSATGALDLIAQDSTHRMLLPWFLVGSQSNPRQASGGPFFSQALQSDSPDPPHSVRTMFVTALGTAAAQSLRDAGLAEVTEEENAGLRAVVGQIAFSMSGGRWGTFEPWPADEVNPMVSAAVTAAGGIVPFLREMVRGSSGGVTWAQLSALWTSSPATKNWVKDRFRDVASGSHEWIPTGFIPQVVETAMAVFARGDVDNALRWITAHTSLRSPTNYVLHKLDIVPTRAPRGVSARDSRLTKVTVSGHVGAFRVPDPDDPTRMVTAGTIGTEAFHDWLRAEFTANSGLGPAGFISYLQGRLSLHVWDGSVADVPDEALDQPVGMLYRVAPGVDVALTLNQLALRQRLNWQRIQQQFAAALAETSR
ncbi:phage tail protein [Streptomyces justiciae]|uniref:Uncharacterized protein n=1 Tax=Streptomyces justiciae TaxID=2780140 RepID=A0ABU3M095_9ACTN|nr:hypothetical protein [Streptomyces justiciae]MDT7844921.1 hypothetical protein [Streptomyces justiciae]